MTIDEVIAHERRLAVGYRNDIQILKNVGADISSITSVTKQMKYHEQFADWLEELVMLRLDRCMIHMPERLHLVENGYNKALNDFAEKLNAKCDGMIKDKWNSNVAPISWAEAYADFKDDIDEIAIQLKAGATND